MVEKKREMLLEQLRRLQWGKLFHMFYIEPVIMALIFAHSLSGTIMRNQVIFQACTTIFNYNESICERLGTSNTNNLTNEIETEVQPYVANLFLTRTLLESIVPAVCGIFIGSWSDYYGRKPLLLISMIGFSLSYVISTIICELSYHMPVNPWYYIIAALPHSVLGGNCVFSVAAYCFLSDVTDMKTRPYRMIFMEALFFIAMTAGSLLSSFIYNASNSTIVLLISSLLLCLATAFTAFCIPETLHLRQNEEMETKTPENPNNNINLKLSEFRKEVDQKTPDDGKKTPSHGEEESPSNEDPPKRVGLFNTIHVKDMFSTCLKKREHYDRSIIWLITGAMFITIFIIDGGMSVVYLYVREKFHWTIREYTFYETVAHSVPMVGAIVGFLILRKIFGVSVVSLALISFFSDIISSIVRALASESWHLYLAVVFGAFRSISGPMCRTIVSNIVPPTDLGKIFSIKNILQSAAPFLAAPLYTFIYQRTLVTFPGMFFIVSAFLYAIAFGLMLVVLIFKYKCRDYYSKVLK